MLMGGGYAVPMMRFKDYNEDWKEEVLDKISQKVIDKNINNKYKNVFTNSAEFGIIDQRDYFDRDIANVENTRGYYVVMPNDFVYNPRISTSAPVGPINRNKLSYEGVVSPLYYVFRLKDDEIDLSYLDYFFKSSIWHGFMYMNGNSGARSDRFSINNNVFSQLPIKYPILNEEQKKIGALFSTLAQQIHKTEQKSLKIRTMKQSLLQKMFA